MPHVITQSCCSDGSCVFACPVNCIHPTPDEPDFATSEMLYIDPATCVDCGACITACPVGAIVPHTRLPVDQLDFLDVNAEFYRTERPRPLLAPRTPPLELGPRVGPLRVAVVGSGPAAMYAADELLTVPGAQVDVYERLDRPYGLARWGVAPDHERTRAVAALFDVITRERGLTLHLGVEIGRDLSHDQLLADHDAVLYAVGAASDRRLDVPGMGLPGTGTATEFVAWYNGHPERAGRSYDLSHPRVVIVGNGNVALDVARILTADPDRLARTDISPTALAALRASAVEEVVVVGRRGPQFSAFTLPELIGLVAERAVSVPESDLVDTATDPTAAQKLRILAEHAGAPGDGRRVVFRYGLTPHAVTGAGRATGMEFRRTGTDEVEVLDAGLVLTSIGYHGRPVPDLPFDDAAGVVPNKGGRVVDPATGAIVPRTYVAGWIKRGPTGFIGTNKSCSLETVRALVADHTGVPARLG
ncbi:FAD-dependent oxidoreductase [Pseudonocardia sp. CA-107938]|uniref:FAD-dependent oxidoreductase n=1 Tax=Pseudonocardia sp. CA-107938 TaxID=3240021 RepID=UPI003D8E44B2